MSILLIIPFLSMSGQQNVNVRFIPDDFIQCSNDPGICFSIEMKADPDQSFELFGINSRMIYDGNTLNYHSFQTDLSERYVHNVGDNLETVNDSWQMLDPRHLSFTIADDASMGNIEIVSEEYQSIGKVCFQIEQEISSIESLCESLVWDKSMSGNEGFQTGDDGVVVVSQDINQGMQFSMNEVVEQYNWVYLTEATGQSDPNAICVERDLLVKNTLNEGEESLRHIVDISCPNDTIYFEQLLQDEVITLTGNRILIDKDLTIIGLGIEDIFISGQENDLVFEIPTGKEVNIEDLALLEGNPANGNLILNHGDLVLRNIKLLGTDIENETLFTNNGLLTLKEQVIIDFN